MRSYVADWPEEYKLVVDQDVVVLFAPPDSTTEWVGMAFINHLPSVSQVVFDWDGSIKARDYKNAEGRVRLEETLADESLLKGIRSYIDMIWTLTPFRD